MPLPEYGLKQTIPQGFLTAVRAANPLPRRSMATVKLRGGSNLEVSSVQSIG